MTATTAVPRDLSEQVAGDVEASTQPQVEGVAASSKEPGVQAPATDEPPTLKKLQELEDHLVLDKEGKSRTFKSLYNGKNGARRVLVVFVRHFFCGNCQAYLQAVSESITPEALLQLPVSTSIVVIGCGDPGLIEMYLEATGSRFPLYSDPTGRLYDELGMVKSLQLGTKPGYMTRPMSYSIVTSIFQGLKQVRSGLVTKSGDSRRNGGEFLFEPEDLASPIMEVPPSAGGLDDPYGPEEKRVTWCRRMRSTRDHTEVPELRKVLGLD